MVKYLKCLTAFVLFLMVVLLVHGCAEKVEEETLIPSMFSTIRIYITDGFKSEGIDSEALSKISYVSIDENLTKDIFSNVMYHPNNKVIWKGCWLGIAKLQNGEEKRLRVSFNEAFYDIIGHQGYYETTEKSREIFREKMAVALKDLTKQGN